MSRFTRHWKLALPLGVLVILATVIASSSIASTTAKDRASRQSPQARRYERKEGS